MNDIITLIKESQTADEYGDPIIMETRRDVFCGMKSIGSSEFYQANASGLKPEIKFILSDYMDYEDEKAVEYNGTRYRVLRTYRQGQEMELTCYTEVNHVGP